jgi:hypothetical protein
VTDHVGQRRDAKGHAFSGIGLALSAERLMEPELVEHDHRQQVGADRSAGHGMEGRRWLSDRRAVLADELLSHRLQNDSLARDDLAALGDALSDLLEIGALAARASLWTWHDDAVARVIIRYGLTCWPLADERRHGHAACLGIGGRELGGDFILGGRGDDIFELHLELIEQVLLAFGRLSEFVVMGFGEAQLELFDDRLGVCGFCLGDGRDLEELGAGGEMVLTLADQQRFERFRIIGKGRQNRIPSRVFYSRKLPFCRGLSSRKPPKPAVFSPPAQAGKYIAGSSSRSPREEIRAVPRRSK